MELPEKPKFNPIKPQEILDGVKGDNRCVSVPSNRLAPLRKAWTDHIYQPIRNEMKVDIRMNTKDKMVQLKNMPNTPDINSIIKYQSYLEAFMLGFDADQIKDAFLKYDEFFVETIDIRDVKRSVHGEHMSRTIGRICGKSGKTKFTIENATKTRIVVAGTKIHIVGTFSAIKIARDSVSRLILGSPPGKVYSRLRAISARAPERF